MLVNLPFTGVNSGYKYLIILLNQKVKNDK